MNWFRLNSPMNNLKVSIVRCLGIFLVSLICSDCALDEDLVSSCEGLSDAIPLTEREALFFDLTLNEEIGVDIPRLRKWNGPINLSIEGTITQELLDELNNVVAELNSLGDFIEIAIITNGESPNLRYFFGTREDYIELFNPNVGLIPDGFNGLVNIARDESFEIKGASIWNDNVNFPGFEFQQHQIREQLARSLGLVNDITSFDNSIFHETINTNRSYSELDEDMIALMLGGILRPGFCPNTIVRAIE